MFAAMAVAILVLRFDPPRVLVSVHNESAAPLFLMRLTYDDVVFARELTLAPEAGTARFCTWPWRRDHMVLEFKRAGELTPTREILALERIPYQQLLVRIRDGDVVVTDIGFEPYVSDSPCLFFR